ncbi:MAG: AAA family ATPase [Chitinophagales bacterium]
MNNITEIAEQLLAHKETVTLLFAFNGSGKTQLSVAYKNVTKAKNNGAHAGVYYNAFSEDLFYWNNDEPGNNFNMRLMVNHSSLSKYHSYLIDNPKLIEDKLTAFRPNYVFHLHQHENPEMGIEFVQFYARKDGPAIKISRGEERIFVWCFFLALFEIDAWSGNQNAHFFIDDPVSSLDDYNIFITADSLFKIIEDHHLKKRIIIATHHIGLYSILYDRLNRGEKSGRYKNVTKAFILSNNNNQLTLSPNTDDVFLFHLHLLKTLHTAANSKLLVYHFVLLRQLLENISSFLGTSRISFVLEQLNYQPAESVINRINSLSHQNVYQARFNEMDRNDADFFKEIIDRLIKRYNFQF